ncbi:hypothetical protein ACFE04_024600 [Oxalis oulophora]
MGSCYSSIAKRNIDLHAHVKKSASSAAAAAAAAKRASSNSSAAANYNTSSSSPKKLKLGGSGRWKRKKSGGGGRDCLSNAASADLLQISGRMAINGSTKTACLFTQQGKKGTNQDSMLVWENFSSRSDTVFCGVFDGHGPFGHMVSKRVRDSLPLTLCAQWKASANDDQDTVYKNGRTESSLSMDDEELHESLNVEDNENFPDTHLSLKQAILKSFRLMDKELKLHPTIDCFCSGTTAVTLVRQGPDLVVGNVGDSRAVLATRDKDNTLTAVQLTVDLKPDLPREAARIHQCKGRVFALQDEPEVARVWLPNNDSPGLAMARAFGDFCLKDFGLISVPDIFYRRLTERDEFIILATDGVWDVLSNKEAVDIVASAPSQTTAARLLVDCAVRAWKLKYPTSKTDDCAVICLFLEHLTTANGATGEDCNTPITPVKATEENEASSEMNGHSQDPTLEQLDTVRNTGEIVPVLDHDEGKSISENSHGHSKRSLAECISVGEDEEWSALEGITRVNSLLSIPRFLTRGDKRSTSWRKWL